MLPVEQPPVAETPPRGHRTGHRAGTRPWRRTGTSSPSNCGCPPAAGRRHAPPWTQRALPGAVRRVHLLHHRTRRPHHPPRREGTGETVTMAGNTPHTVRNESTEDAVALQVHAPGGPMEGFIRSAAQLAADPADDRRGACNRRAPWHRTAGSGACHGDEVECRFGVVDAPPSESPRRPPSWSLDVSKRRPGADHGVRQHGEHASDGSRVGGAAEREPQRPGRLVGAAAHGEQHLAGLMDAGRTGRTRRTVDPGGVGISS